MTGEEAGADDLAVHLLEVQRLKEGRPLKGVPTRAHISCEVPTPFHPFASKKRKEKTCRRRRPVLLKLASMPICR
jgi:hypothetical protein